MTSKQMLLGGAVLLAACRYQPTVIPLAGSPTEIAVLAGDWQGDYTSDDTRRSGHIMFRISARGDSAFGDVMMFVPGYNTFPLPWDQATAHLEHARSPDFLAIRFVAVGGGQVGGELEPYTAPDCNCLVRTRFIGRVRGDEIRGRYTSKADGIPERVGRWQVKRATK
ncbi:MAG: hypothetical protein V4558_02460 [Gemmatimonadota bacterium]